MTGKRISKIRTLTPLDTPAWAFKGYVSAYAKSIKSHMLAHSGKSVTIRESNHASGVYKEHYAKYYVPKSSILLAGTGVWKIHYVACGFSSIKISRINEVCVFLNKISLQCIAIFY